MPFSNTRVTKTELQQAIRAHPVVVGQRMDGYVLWACRDSGNVTAMLSDEAYTQKHDEWEDLADPSSPEPERRTVFRHPVWNPRCDGITCHHVPLTEIDRVTELERVLEVLETPLPRKEA
jgi:hypothetical protein